MAYLSTICTSYEIDVYVEGLDTNYNSDVIRTCDTTISLNGVSVAVNSSKIPNQVSSAYVTTFYGLKPNTGYDISCLITYNTGSVTLTTAAATEPLPRPDDWEWWDDIYSDADINIYASEWNSFCERINDFREYKELDEWSFTTVYTDDYISASICNQAWYAINGIDGCGTMPSLAVTDGNLFASFFTGLRDALNSIP